LFKGDAESLMAAMRNNAAKNPDKVLEIQRVIEEDDHGLSRTSTLSESLRPRLCERCSTLSVPKETIQRMRDRFRLKLN